MATNKSSKKKKETPEEKKNKELREKYAKEMANFEKTSNTILDSVRENGVSIHTPNPQNSLKQSPEEISDIHILFSQQYTKYGKEGEDTSEKQEKKSESEAKSNTTSTTSTTSTTASVVTSSTDPNSSKTNSNSNTSTTNPSTTPSTTTDATATATPTKTATTGYKFSGESKGYQAYKPSEWTTPKEILFSEFTITETDLRVKTAQFTSPYYIDLTNGRACVWIQRKYGENFGGVILSCEFNADTGLYTYQCQDWNRLLTNKVYVILSGDTKVYDIIQKLLVKCNLSTDGLLNIDKYNEIIEEIPSDDDPEEVISSSSSDNTTSSTTSTSSTTTDDKNKSTNKNQEQGTKTTTDTAKSKKEKEENKKAKYNPFYKKPQGLYDKLTARDFIMALVMKAGISIDIHMDENGVLRFDPYEKETWNKERWYFVDTDIYDAKLKFDITNIITQVAVKHTDALNGDATLYTSEKLIGVNLAAFFGVMGTVIDNPVKATASSGGGTVNDGNIITVSGKPSTACCQRAYGGVRPPYKTVTRSYRNYCPMCGKSGTLQDTPKAPGHVSPVPEGEITCGNYGPASKVAHTVKGCDADYCICCGYDKNGTCRSRLQPAGSTATTTATTSTATTSVPTNNTTSTNTSANTSANATASAPVTDPGSTSTGSNITVENYTKNKIAARIAFSESIRKWFTFSFKVPGEYQNLHTNSFCMLMMSKKFVLKNMPTIGKKLNGKFTRYLGYEKNRYYIEGVTVTYGTQGLSTELKLNPFASDYSTFAKTQEQAYEALQSALGGGSGGSGSTRAAIFAKAATWVYAGGGGGSSHDPLTAYQWTEKYKRCDCFGASASLFYQFSHFTNIPVRVVWGYSPKAGSGTHFTIQLKENGQWIDPPEYHNMTQNLRVLTRYPRQVYNGQTTEP
ncbi:hypothetical protein [Methanosphaera sp.]|jgi:hypothetical protein|uniref:hypothetical protein n=1 Tax=Methanosphaera sp. TaxID=2666342 RepID=UPI003D90E06D